MTTANIISALATVASWVAVWLNFRITRENKKTIVLAAWDDARIYRTHFWPIVRNAYAMFRDSRGSNIPESLDVLLGSAGMPPGVPLKNKQKLRNWHEDYGSGLNTDQRNLWDFVSAVYPPRTGGMADFLEASIIENKDTFHRARQVIGTFFQRGRERLSNRALNDIAGHAYEDVILLSWLEIALVRGTRDDGPGKKNKLFVFGKYLSKKR